MSCIEENCLAGLHMRAKTGRTCVGQWQKAGSEVNVLFVRVEEKSADRELKGALEGEGSIGR